MGGPMNYITLRNQMIQQAAKTKTPIMGEFELTPSCNLACKMCYVRETQSQKELTTSQWKELFLEAKKEGLLFCLLTGGEIFLRKDFQELYEYIYDLGIRVSLYTNGTLITDEVVSFLSLRKPDFIGITLYGANPEQYKEITGSSLAFHQVEAGIKRLQEANIPLLVRTIAIQSIYQNLDEVIQYFKDHHFSVSYSLYVGPRRSCPGSESVDRLTPSELVDYKNQFLEAFGVSKSIEVNDCFSSFRCVAGKSSYFVRWDGTIMPCAMLEVPRFDALLSFKKAWGDLGEAIQKVPLCDEYATCSLRSTCIQCPASRYLEGGFSKCSSYLKEIARELKEKES